MNKKSLLFILFSTLLALSSFSAKSIDLSTTIGIGVFGTTALTMTVISGIDMSLDATEKTYLELRMDALDYLADERKSTLFAQTLEQINQEIYPEKISSDQFAAKIIALEHIR